MTTRFIGQPITRNEDPDLLRGRGRFVGDFSLPNTAHACVLRSPHAHARIQRVDLAAARALPGVLLAWAADDVGPIMRPNSVFIPHAALTNPRTHYPLAREKARYVGEPVAFVVAESRYLAEDAAEAIAVEYEPLPPVVDLAAALASGFPLVHEDLGTNRACTLSQTLGDVSAGFATADRVLDLRVTIDRGAANPMEPRGLMAHFDRTEGKLTVWSTTQTPGPLRNSLAAVFGLLASDVRVVAPHVGGGFGCKAMIFYPEDLLVPFAAITLGRPVKWLEDRREHFFAANQEREQTHEVQVGITADGRITALRDHFVHDTGAYISYGPIVAHVASLTLPGPYKLANLEVRGDLVYTNKTLVSPYRGAGRAHAVFVMERVIRAIAQDLGLDPADVRARNLIPADEMPYDYGLTWTDGGPLRYDSGDFPKAFQLALARIDYDQVRRNQAEMRAGGRYLGIAVVPFVEGAGPGPYEGARVRVDGSGTVEVHTAVATQGQGHYTIFAQIVAEELAVSPRDVRVVTGDTGLFAWGVGTYASRVAVVGGSAVLRAARRVRDKALELAAGVLEADAADLELVGGRVQVQGTPGRAVPLGQLAVMASIGTFSGKVPVDFVPGLEATAFFTPEQSTFPYGVHALVVEVDPATGQVAVRRYLVVHDCGTVLNPLILDGQIHGGVAQGLGNSFYERLIYDEDGQLLTASFMDYLLPSAEQIPTIEVVHMETPSPLNPLGAKGAGEGGVIPVAAAFVEAVEDALSPFGVRFQYAPLSPGHICQAVQARH